jgi:hypothetical protein
MEKGLDQRMDMRDSGTIIEEILGEADALIRRRLQARGLEVSHLIVAMTPDDQVILRSNVLSEALPSFAKDLEDVVDELIAPIKH